MWILKNSKDLLEYVQSRPLSSNKNIETFEFLPFTQLLPILNTI